jgi:hypothetical protein
MEVKKNTSVPLSHSLTLRTGIIQLKSIQRLLWAKEYMSLKVSMGAEAGIPLK